MLLLAFAWNCCLATAQTTSHNSSLHSTVGGKKIFSASCAQCHGLDAKGGERAPNIADPPAVQRLSNAQISGIIQNGLPGTGMPAFPSLEPAQVRMVVAYLRTLQGKNNAAPLPGNPEAGSTLFFGKAGCSQCHMVGGKGGFIASDLSEYARVHEADQIRNAILDPASSAGRARFVTITLDDGKTLRGRVRDEDNFSLQLQALDGTFFFLSKSQIHVLQDETQPLMPSDYNTRLNSHELNDVISYLIRAAGGRDAAAQKQAEESEY